MEHLERGEKQSSEYSISDDVHTHFRYQGKLAQETESAPNDEIEVSEYRARALGSKFQGDIGEGITLRVATDRLGLMADPRFDQVRHGYDAVYLDSKGHPVIIESKFDERGIKALRGDQMQPSWIERNAKMMQNPMNERYSPGNAEIGVQVEEIGYSNIRRLCVALDHKILEGVVWEGQSDGSWKEIDRFSVFNFEQPYLK